MQEFLIELWNIKDPSQSEKLINHDEQNNFKDQSKLKIN